MEWTKKKVQKCPQQAGNDNYLKIYKILQISISFNTTAKQYFSVAKILAKIMSHLSYDATYTRKDQIKSRPVPLKLVTKHLDSEIFFTQSFSLKP